MKFKLFLIIPFLFLACEDPEEISTETESLSQKEIDHLQFLKEEEKLARDVYLFSYDLYGHNIFNNISKSEQIHMNSVTVILEKYDIKDLSVDERGEFTNHELQKLYDDLTDLSKQSLADAFIAGATIEDLDINDLDSFIRDTDYLDIEDMYNKLNCGSANHLRAYIGVLETMDVQYISQFISEEEFNSILESSGGNCNN